MGDWDIWNVSARALGLFGPQAPPTGTEQLEALCPTIRQAWVRRGLHVLTVGGAWRRQTAMDPARWSLLASVGTSPLVIGGLLVVIWATSDVAGCWPWVPILAAVGLGASRALGVLLRALGERVVVDDAACRTTYVTLKCALFAPPAYRAAWWRRLRVTLGPSHDFVGYMIERHAADGGIPGLSTDELLPMLESDRPSTRLAALSSLDQAVDSRSDSTGRPRAPHAADSTVTD